MCVFFCKFKPWRYLQAFNKLCLPQIVLATKPYYVYVYFMMFVATTAIAHDMTARVRPRFFDQVGHQTNNASIGNEYFFTQ